MTATAFITVDADELTVLVGDRPDTRAYAANPVDLVDRAEAQLVLAALRTQSVTILVGIEFDDPQEPGNRIVLVGDDLKAVQFIDNCGNDFSSDQALGLVDGLAQVRITNG